MDLCGASTSIRENFYRQEEKDEQELYTTTTTTTITTTTTVFPSQYAKEAPHLVKLETPLCAPTKTGRLNIVISSGAASEADTCPGGSCKSSQSFSGAKTPVSLFSSGSSSLDQHNLFFQPSPEEPQKEVQQPPSRVLKEVRKDENGRFTTTHVPRTEATGYDDTYKKMVTHVADTHRKKVTCSADVHERGWARHSSSVAPERASDRKPPEEADSFEEDEGVADLQGLLIESRFMSMKSGLTPQQKRSRHGRKKDELDFQPIGNTNTIYQNASLIKAMESKTFSSRKSRSPMALLAKGPSSFFTQLKDFSRNPISEIKKFSRYAVGGGDSHGSRAPCMPKVNVVMRLMGAVGPQTRGPFTCECRRPPGARLGDLRAFQA